MKNELDISKVVTTLVEQTTSIAAFKEYTKKTYKASFFKLLIRVATGPSILAVLASKTSTDTIIADLNTATRITLISLLNEVCTLNNISYREIAAYLVKNDAFELFTTETMDKEDEGFISSPELITLALYQLMNVMELNEVLGNENTPVTS